LSFDCVRDPAAHRGRLAFARIATAHSSGIPALRRPSFIRSFISTKRVSPRSPSSTPSMRRCLERPGGGQREIALQRLARFRITIGQGERRHKDQVRKRVGIGIDRDRPASQFNRLVIILQPKIGPRLVFVPIDERRIGRARPNRPVDIFKAFVELTEISIVYAQLAGGGRPLQIAR
jgi:hypothetical protein